MKNTVVLRKIFAVTILLLAVAAFFVFPFVSSDGALADTASDYVYGNINVTADVGEDKVIRITENFQVGFKSEGKTQIIRRILFRYQSARYADGRKITGGRFLARVSDVSASVNGEPTETVAVSGGKYCDVHVYSADGSAFGTEHGSTDDLYDIRLSYTYDLSGDKVKGLDDLVFVFFNEQSFRYYLEYQRLTLTLNMPKPFEEQAFSVRNADGAQEWQPNAERGEGFELYGNSVKLTVNADTVKYLTAQFILPDGYFDITATVRSEYWIFFGITCAAIAFTLVISFIYRKKKPVAPVELYPPEINLLHYSAFWHGRAKRKDVCAVIFQWAQAGCVRIIKDGKKDIILQKLNELPENTSEEEKKYFNALFLKGNEYRSGEIKKIQNISQAFRIGDAVSGLVNQAETPDVFKADAERAKLLVLSASVMAALTSLIYFILFYSDAGLWIFFGMVAAVAVVGLAGVYAKWREIVELKEGYRFAYKILAYGFLCFVCIVCIMYGILLSTVYLPAYDYAGLLYINIIWLALSAFVLPAFIGRRTEEAQMLYGRMLGFKRFILTAELSRIEALIDKNPDYFYQILPYCMVMGISRKLDRRLEYIHFAAPEWAVGFSLKGIAAALFASAKSALKSSRGEEKNNSGTEHTYEQKK